MKLSKNQKILTGIGSFVLLIGTAIGIKKYKDNHIFDNSIPPTNAKDVIKFPLKYGDSNILVNRIQNWLNKNVILRSVQIQKQLGLSKLKEDGIFGKNTLNAVSLILKTNEVTKSMFEKINA